MKEAKPQELAAFKQRIAELESLLQQAESKVARLSEERDQLCQISSELRAELNRQQRLISDMMHKQSQKSPTANRMGDFGGEEPKTMFDENLRYSQASQEQIMNYGDKLNEIAGELQDWVKHQKSPAQKSPKRPLQVLKSPDR